jgi:hypothetical protein
VLRDSHGSWGYLKAWRNREDRSFALEDLQLLTGLAPHLGSALSRRHVGPGLPEQMGAAPDWPASVLILDAELNRRSSTPSAQAWLDVLPGATIAQRHGNLPQTIYAVAARASATACPSVRGLPARLRTRTTDGRWAVIEAAPLQGSDADAVAVTLRAATGADVLDLVCRAHALTARESEVPQLVVGGLPTHNIADRLCISTNTLQDHLKAIFDKIGVRTLAS